MEETGILSKLSAVMLSTGLEFMEPLRYYLLLGFILILVDLRFGIKAAKMRKESIRFSRALRRTLNKAFDYLCWIFLAGAIGATFSVPFNITTIPAMVMLVVYGIEINSCFSNYFESKGKKIKVDIFKFFTKKTDIINVEEKEDNNGTA